MPPHRRHDRLGREPEPGELRCWDRWEDTTSTHPPIMIDRQLGDGGHRRCNCVPLPPVEGGKPCPDVGLSVADILADLEGAWPIAGGSPFVDRIYRYDEIARQVMDSPKGFLPVQAHDIFSYRERLRFACASVIAGSGIQGLQRSRMAAPTCVPDTSPLSSFPAIRMWVRRRHGPCEQRNLAGFTRGPASVQTVRRSDPATGGASCRSRHASSFCCRRSVSPHTP